MERYMKTLDSLLQEYVEAGCVAAAKVPETTPEDLTVFEISVRGPGKDASIQKCSGSASAHINTAIAVKNGTLKWPRKGS